MNRNNIAVSPLRKNLVVVFFIFRKCNFVDTATKDNMEMMNSTEVASIDETVAMLWSALDRDFSRHSVR